MARKLTESSRSVESAPAIPCAHETCQQPAICRLKLPTGWARLCMPHYEAHFGEQGRAAMVEHGLVRWGNESRPEFTRRVMEYWRLLSRKSPMRKGLNVA